MPEIVIELAEGRSVDVKRALARDVTEAVHRILGGDPNTILVTIHENPRTDKARGGVLYCDR